MVFIGDSIFKKCLGGEFAGLDQVGSTLGTKTRIRLKTSIFFNASVFPYYFSYKHSPLQGLQQTSHHSVQNEPQLIRLFETMTNPPNPASVSTGSPVTLWHLSVEGFEGTSILFPIVQDSDVGDSARNRFSSGTNAGTRLA